MPNPVSLVPEAVEESQPAPSGGPRLRTAVRNTAETLQRDYLDSRNHATQAYARSVLAKLRKYAASSLESQPLALEEVLLLLNPALTEQELSQSDGLSPSERAAFHALAMYGIHMQGADAAMHRPNQSFARACGRFYAQSESKSTKPRFDAMMIASEESARLIHIRSLVTLLRGANLGFDYGQFAQDLRILLTQVKNQEQLSRRQAVLLRWGRDFATGSYTSASS